MSTDLQNRLNFIEEQAREIKRRQQQATTGSHANIPGKDEGDVAMLAYLVTYLAGILRKHLETGER